METLHLYKNEDGTIYKATQGEAITRDFLQEQVDRATAELHQWSSALAEFDRLTKPVAKQDKPEVEKPRLEAVEIDDHRVSFQKVPVI